MKALRQCHVRLVVLREFTGLLLILCYFFNELSIERLSLFSVEE